MLNSCGLKKLENLDPQVLVEAENEQLSALDRALNQSRILPQHLKGLRKITFCPVPGESWLDKDGSPVTLPFWGYIRLPTLKSRVHNETLLFLRATSVQSSSDIPSSICNVAPWLPVPPAWAAD